MSISSQLLALLPFLALAMGSTQAPASLPQVDFSRMGTVGLGGSFSGLDWWSNSSPFASASSSSSTSFSTDAETLFVRLENGSYQPLGNTNAGGTISSLCWSNATDTNGTLYIGGAFDSIGGETANNIASYSLASSTFASLSSGLSGAVETLYCDNENKQIWAGGQFAAPSGSGGNVGVWDPETSAWTSVPFGGLNGRVSIIESSADGKSLYFGGHFTTSFASNSSVTTNSTTTGNITSVESAPDGTSTTGNSGYLTPVNIPYSANQNPNVQIEISASSSTSQTNYRDPHVLICPGEAAWLAADNTPTTINIIGINWMRANGVRLVNELVQGRGTETFS